MIYKLLVFCFCTFGLFYQVFNISDTYFHYATFTQVLIFRKQETKPPSLQVCFNLSAYNVNLLNYTAFEVFNLSPGKAESIVALNRHSTTNYGYAMKTAVNEMLIKKSIKGQAICFNLKLKDSLKEFRLQDISNSFISPGYYIANLNTHGLDYIDYASFYMKHRNSSFHGLSTEFTEVFVNRNCKERRRFVDNYITLDHQEFQSLLLLPPYHTNCLDYHEIGLNSKDQCYDECLIRASLQAFNKFPFTALVQDIPANRQKKSFISETDNYDELFMMQLRKLELQCENLCHRRDCTEKQFAPRLVSTGVSENITIDMYLSSSPTIQSVYSPLMKAIDYICYILGCFSFWLGFSPLGISMGFQKRRRNACLKKQGVYDRLNTQELKMRMLERKILLMNVLR